MGVKGQPWNGGGQTLLSKEKRQEIAVEIHAKREAQKSGWPKPVAHFGQPDYYQKTDAEFQTRLENAKWK